jgi:vacuolar-type H+-ATPase subunit I/STV1
MIIIWVCILCGIFLFFFSINSPELLEMAAIDFIAVIATTCPVVTHHFEGPWPVLIVSHAAGSLGTRSFYVSPGSHE